MINKHRNCLYTARCFMCGKDLTNDLTAQAISHKGFFTSGDQTKYGWVLWVHEDCVSDLISVLEIDLKKLKALRRQDAERNSNESEDK